MKSDAVPIVSVACRVQVDLNGKRVSGCSHGWTVPESDLPKGCPDCGGPLVITGRYTEIRL